MKIFPKIGKKYASLAVLISLIFVFVVVAYFYVNYNFIVSQELSVRLNPNFDLIELKGGEEHTKSFSVSVNNHFLCNSLCEVKLASVDSGDQLFFEKFNVSNSFRKDYEFSFSQMRVGEGQENYNFKVRCNNVASNICITSEGSQVRDSVFTINFELNSSKEEFRENMREKLEFISNNLSLEFEASENVFANINLSMFDVFEFFEVRTGLDLSYKSFLEINELFRVQNFDSISLFEVNTTFRDEETRIREFIVDYNELLNDYNSLNIQEFLIENNVYLSNESYLEILTLKEFIELEFEVGRDLDLINSSYLSLLELLENSWFEINESKGIVYLLYQANCDNMSCVVDLDNVCEFIDVKIENNLNKEVNQDLISTLINYTISEGFVFEEHNSSFNENLFLSNQTTRLENNHITRLEEIRNRCEQNISLSSFNQEALEFKEIDEGKEISVNEAQRICCYNGKCHRCCEGGECKDKNPVILLHGYSFSQRTDAELSTDSFNSLKNRLQRDGYMRGFILSPGQSISRDKLGVMGQVNKSTVFRATYYSVTVFDEFGAITSLSKSENIDTYAIRLKDIIEYALMLTGREKVDIIAHSMGGLVTRRYMQIFGDDLVDNVILIGTPNHGISERVYNLCTIFGSNRECEDMRGNSLFMSNINDPRNAISDYRMHVIRAKGCDMPEGAGDGVILSESVYLENQFNYLVTGECEGTITLHSRILSPNRFPEVYEIISSVLNS